MLTIKIPIDYQVPEIIDKHERYRLLLLNRFIEIFLFNKTDRSKFVNISTKEFTQILKMDNPGKYIKQLSTWIEINNRYSTGNKDQKTFTKSYRLRFWDQPLKIKVITISERAYYRRSLLPNIHKFVNLYDNIR